MANILLLKIYLKDIKPKIWRRFFVSDNISFHQLHNIIQEIMGWENYHLYSFNIDGIRIELSDEEGYSEYESENSKKIKFNKYIRVEKQKFYYEYDFGDSWEHEIVVEKIFENLPEGIKQIPYCLEGQRACPPEDCGGVWGYEELIKICKDKNHPDYEERIKDWLGEDWDFEKFNVSETNKKLR
ncbi:plasmid pRiA4b ORF-3 family protein [Candidatus Pacearchaeota archaeon]|nr:plasmid pRiA4b ORF-3 family protein [Candidatus Pacearchaeota archaeon]